MPTYPDDSSPDTFSPARDALEAMIVKLRTGESLDHAEAEALIDDEGTELLRQVKQGFLDLCTARESRDPVTGSDDVERRHRRRSACSLLTLFGPVTVNRVAMSMRGVSALMPLDAVLNLPLQKYSFGVQKRAVLEAATGSFDQVVDNIRRTTGAAVAKRQVEEVVVHAMTDFDAYYAHAPVEQVAPGDFLVLTFDGKGVVMRREGLRPETRRRAETTEQKLTSRLSPGEKRNRKRMAEVAAVYTVSPWVRTTDQVLKAPGCGPTPPRPKPRNKRVWASLVDDARAVIHGTFDEAVVRDPELKRTWVVLVDGNKDQVRYAREAARRIGQPVTLVLDVIHAIEYVWKAAWALYDKGDRAAEAWVRDKLRRLLDGKVSTVAAGIRRTATKRGLTGTKREAVDKCADYLLNHKDMMRYDRYLAAGMPIGTGVIEGACRYLIKDRMDITGARWGLERAEAVLKARALRVCGDIDEYFAFHQARELERNHLSRYADHELRALREAA